MIDSSEDEVRWLDAGEMAAWRSYVVSSALLEHRLNRDLQEAHDLSMADYEILVRLSEQAPFYLFITFVLTYGTQQLGMPRGQVLNYTLIAAAIGFVTIPLSGHLSDRYGRKTVYGAGIVLTAAFAFPYFWLLDTKVGWLVLVGIVVSLIVHDVQYGPQAALIAEGFGTNVRYSGAGLGYQLSSVIAGGPAPPQHRPAAVDHRGAQVGDRGLGVAQPGPVAVEAGERLLHHVLGRGRFVDQQDRQPHHAHPLLPVQVLQRQRLLDRRGRGGVDGAQMPQRPLDAAFHPR